VTFETEEMRQKNVYSFYISHLTHTFAVSLFANFPLDFQNHFLYINNKLRLDCGSYKLAH